MTEKKMIDLDYSNGWQERPEIVKNCNHERDTERTRFNCVTKYTCKICGYFYHVDSSGWHERIKYTNTNYKLFIHYGSET